jgi:hypothetical protein
MKKTRLLWVLPGLVALALVLLVGLWPRTDGLSLEKAKVEQLPEGQVILCNAWPETKSVQKGDSFLYTIEVLYDTSQISGIDRDSLDSAVNLQPFEIRSTIETEFNLSSEVGVYQRQYELQFIIGTTTQTYSFPSIVVRYQLRDGNGFAETSVVPESVYIAPRIPASDVNSIVAEIKAGNSVFQPTIGTIEDKNQNRLPQILLTLGCVLIIAIVVDVILRVMPQWKENVKQNRERQMSKVVRQAYRSLLDNIASGAEPKSLLHQIDLILRLVLSPKESVGWLEEQNFELATEDVRPLIISLFDKSQMAYCSDDITPKDVEDALKQLEEIFKCYYIGEPEEWRI